MNTQRTNYPLSYSSESSTNLYVSSKHSEDNLFQQFKRRFLVKSGEKMLPIREESIAYFRTEGRWTYLITDSNKQYLIDHNLRDLEPQMDPSLFFRLNRNYLVHFNSLVYLKPYMQGQLLARLNPIVEDKITISRDKSRQLKEWLNR